ncbi:conserved hypothetical protein [Ricinus communis]|uniref:Uncharacterized protein n=1 Tax=Ricinus communis TaxID=3988 RepID=B9SRI5_RICCO|nr:conserved hypothetical protein [Ricinus communis]
MSSSPSLTPFTIIFLHYLARLPIEPNNQKTSATTTTGIVTTTIHSSSNNNKIYATIIHQIGIYGEEETKIEVEQVCIIYQADAMSMREKEKEQIDNEILWWMDELEETTELP